MRLFVIGLLLSMACGNAFAGDLDVPLSGWTLRPDDVVFMYPANDLSAYKAYGATVLAWGGAHSLRAVKELRDLGIHPTGTAWCLTAGCETLHADPDLADAVCRDIEGKPIVVPWQPYSYKGTPTWFGCTNHPAFRAWVRKQVSIAMAGGADGLQVDDYMGSAHAATEFGGCFCDYCMNDFRQWLIAHSKPQLLAQAKVKSFDNFDYRALVRQFATNRADYVKIQDTIPLHKQFIDCQIQLAVEHVCQLGRTAAQIVNHPITLSTNNGLPWPVNLPITEHLSYMVSEVDHHADKGTTRLGQAIAAYRMAEAIGKPIAATATGGDWAFIKKNNAVNLVKVWIALGYANGERLMTPNRVWCFSKEKGSDFYEAPREVFAPMYQFVRHNPQLFDGLKVAGPLAIPADLPMDFSTVDSRDAFVRALGHGNPRPPKIADGVWAFPRTGADLSVVHILNMDYDAAKDSIAVKHDLTVKMSPAWFGKSYKDAMLYRPDADPVKLAITQSDGQMVVSVPELTDWAIICLK